MNGEIILHDGEIEIGSADSLGSSGASSGIMFNGGHLVYGSGVTTDLSGRLNSLGGDYHNDTGENDVVFGETIGASSPSTTVAFKKSGSGKLTLSQADPFAPFISVQADGQYPQHGVEDGIGRRWIYLFFFGYIIEFPLTALDISGNNVGFGPSGFWIKWTR